MAKRATVRPTLLFRLLMGLVLAPAIFLVIIWVCLVLLFPLIVRAGISVQGAAVVIGVAIVGYYVLAFAFELEVVSAGVARFVGRRWADRVKAAEPPWRYFFYTE